VLNPEIGTASHESVTILSHALNVGCADTGAMNAVAMKAVGNASSKASKTALLFPIIAQTPNKPLYNPSLSRKHPTL
jgi:hypothetical protein